MKALEPETRDLEQLFQKAEKLGAHLIESIRCGAYIADLQGRVIFTNQGGVNILGYQDKNELLGLMIDQHFYADPGERSAFLKTLEKKGFVQDHEVQIVRRDGSTAIISVTSQVIRNARQEIIGVEGIFHDITDRKAFEARIQREKDKMEQLLGFWQKVCSVRKLDKLLDMIVEKTATIMAARRCSLMLFDETTAELCIKAAVGLSEAVVANTRIRLGEGIAGRVAEEGLHLLVPDIENDECFSRKNLACFRGRSFMSVAIRLNEQLIGVINVADKAQGREVFDETDLKVLVAIATQSAIAIENAKLYREMEYLTVTDPLTRLANYRFFVTSLEDEIMRYQRFQRAFSLLMIDIDDFKDYNDRFGHLEGDMLLIECGKILTGQLRAIDKICRYGGDEFVVLLPGADGEKAKSVAEKLRKQFEGTLFKKPVTVSIGICEYRSQMTRFDMILKSDRALYRAKREGKNQVVLNRPHEQLVPH